MNQQPPWKPQEPLYGQQRFDQQKWDQQVPQSQPSLDNQPTQTAPGQLQRPPFPNSPPPKRQPGLWQWYKSQTKKLKLSIRCGMTLAALLFFACINTADGSVNLATPSTSTPTIPLEQAELPVGPTITDTPTPTPTLTPTPTPTPKPTSQSETPQPVGQTGGWHLIFNDEFDGTAVDSTKWKQHEDWYSGPANGVSQPSNSAETDAYDPAQNRVRGGTLQDTVIYKPITINGKMYPYRSGFIGSFASFSYGYMETRMYLPAAGNGQVANWPVFWASGPNWPTNGEIDIVEGLGGCAAWHFHSPNTNLGACSSGNYTGWHTFGADWEPTSITFYYDGKQVGSTTTVGSGIVSNPIQMIFAGNQTGVWAGPLLVPATVQVDYIRVWQRCSTNCTTSIPTGTSISTLYITRNTWW